jgi:hypothetical protein
LELIRWFITKEICYPDAAACILEGGAENYLNSFKEKYNEIICRVAGFHFVHYRAKFYSLYTLNAQQTHTQKIFVKLDTLREMIDTDVSNSDFVSENLNNYHLQVEDLYANI